MKLIVNADDYGLTLNISKAILNGLKNGLLTDTCAIVNTLDFKASADMALALGIKEMGLHFLLTMGYPVLPPKEIPTLVNKEGKFYNRNEFKNIEINILEVEKELEAQIQLFLSTGLKLNHFTTHHAFMNKNKEMTNLMIKLTKKYNVPIRNEASRYGTLELVEYYKNNGIIMPELIYFNQGIPHHTVDSIKSFLLSVKDKYNCIEIGCHPGISDDYLRKISPLNDNREKEYEVIMDESLKQFLNEMKIERISFCELGELYEKNINESR